VLDGARAFAGPEIEAALVEALGALLRGWLLVEVERGIVVLVYSYFGGLFWFSDFGVCLVMCVSGVVFGRVWGLEIFFVDVVL
ncbi:hypothetical protein, partial [Klebsiella pneumoniae]|uniref:hypothetical protein n=1 Tax=Klebsiella pneumoniae TaxID=573 RepID=UPI003B5C0727